MRLIDADYAIEQMQSILYVEDCRAAVPLPIIKALVCAALKSEGVTPTIKDRWISVKDRLPEVKMSDVNGKIAFSDYVLIHKVHEDGTQRMTVDTCRVDKAAWMTAMPGEGWTVTHWMPLPEPPEVEA